MAEAATASHIPTLSEQYLLKDNEEKVDVVSKSVLSEEKAAEAPVAASEEKAEDTSDAAAAEEKAEDTSDAAAPEEKIEDIPAENSSEDASSVDAESNETTEDQKVDEEASDETPEIKLETAPADFRFPTTNQTRHCFTRYIEYHRCIAAKGEGAQECDRFAKYYRSLCPSEWVERWNEQRENGTFPGPL